MDLRGSYNFAFLSKLTGIVGAGLFLIMLNMWHWHWHRHPICGIKTKIISPKTKPVKKFDMVKSVRFERLSMIHGRSIRAYVKKYLNHFPFICDKITARKKNCLCIELIWWWQSGAHRVLWRKSQLHKQES